MDTGDGRFERRSADEEFTEYTNREIRRLHDSDADFDEMLYKRAVELVLEKIRDNARR